ncbi:MAG TPA: hypothetical protein VFW94_23800 [Candidatus Acidoferrales bacterium]|nr:hypothetical protein [Candidatus Acidoferrales bacterium]
MATDPQYLSADEREASNEIQAAAPNALAIINQSEHAAMVTTANLPTNRRSLKRFSDMLMQYATHSQSVAQSMFYSLPRANKQIIGPSVRFAEIVAPCWRNNSTGSRLIGTTEDSVTAQGVFIDYEANTRNVKEIPRRITDAQGHKFGADMILTTAKAALSIAYREAILKGGVPMALYNPAYEEAKLTAVGKAMSLNQRIDAAMEYLAKLGVTEWQVMNAVGCASPKEMEVDHLLTIRVLCDEIRKGTRSIEEVFGSPYDKEIEKLFTQLGKNETERRLLRNSYMGNAVGLVEYLRSKAGAGAAKSTAVEPPPPAAEAAPVEAPAADGAKKRGRPKKDSATVEKAAAPAQDASEPEQEQGSAQAEPAQEPQSDKPQEGDQNSSDLFNF